MNPDGRKTLAHLIQTAEEAHMLARAGLSIGATWNADLSVNWYKMSATQATVLFLDELLMEERSQLRSWMAKKGYESGLPLWRISSASPYGAILIWRMYHSTTALLNAVQVLAGSPEVDDYVPQDAEQR